MFLDFMEAIDIIIKQQMNQEMQFITENSEDKDKNRKPSITQLEETYDLEAGTQKHSMLPMETISDKNQTPNLQFKITSKNQSNINKISKI